MKLGKTKDVETFVDQLKSEGEKVTNKMKSTGAGLSTESKTSTPAVNQEGLEIFLILLRRRSVFG